MKSFNAILRAQGPVSWQDAIAHGAAIALAYLVAGKLGLLLAIPPGYASAVWPPSGIALGSLLLLGPRYWPGVWIGSFLTNLPISLEVSTGTAGLMQSLLPAAGIGTGAAIQAAAGAILIRRVLGLPLQLDRERQILVFFALAGPVASLVNPSIGVATLWLAGKIPASALAYNWWTWWVGDTIGAILFTPLVVMWFGGRRWHKRRVAVTLPLAATFVAAVLVFIYTSRLEWARLQQHFREDAQELVSAIERRLDLNLELLRAVGGLFAASRDVNEAEFSAFASTMLTDRQDLRAIEWAPHVPAAARPDIERRLPIFEREAGRRIRARERADYFPLLFAEPAHTNPVLGFDLGSEEDRLRALQAARDTGGISVTPPLDLVQGDGTPDGFLMVLPIYKRLLSPDADVAQRRENLHSFALAAIRAPALVRRSIRDIHAVPLPLAIHDSATSRQLYSTPTNTRVGADASWAGRAGLTHTARLRVADREWTLEFVPTLEYLAGHRTLVAWMVLAAGLLFAGMVGAGALAVTGRTVAVEALVRQRTAELARTNRRLAKADRIKSEFISTVTHELRTPLTSIRGSLGLLGAGAAGALPEKARGLVDIAYRNTTRLALLIDDILDVEKLDSGKLSLDLQTHSLPALVEQAVESNQDYARSRNVTFQLRRPLSEAQVNVDSNRLLQVLANLLSNAAKFSPEGGVVEIGVANTGERARVTVKDRGPGIPAAFRARIFQRFSQADGSDSRGKGGTGLGLAISKALMERMQGTIDYQTAEGKGTTFSIELPLAGMGARPAGATPAG